MVQNETRGFSFRKNSKKDGRREKSGVGFQYIMHILSVQKKKSPAQVLYMISFIRTKKRVGPAIAAVEVSRSTRSHPIENVRPLFYSKSTMLSIVESLIFFSGLCSSRTKGIVISFSHVWLLAQFHLRRGCRWTGSSAGAHEYHGP